MFIFALSLCTVVALGVVALILYRQCRTLDADSHSKTAELETLLRQRHRLVADLGRVGQGATGYQKLVLMRTLSASQAATTALSVGDMVSVSRAETQVSQGIEGFFAFADPTVLRSGRGDLARLYATFMTLETDLARAQASQHHAVATLNATVHETPRSVIATTLGMKRRTALDIGSSSRRAAPEQRSVVA
jgi:hypothetical protein